MDKVGMIYMATSPSGKVYIGQTTRSLHQRKYFHFYYASNTERNVKFSNAIRKYGEDIEWIVLHDNVPIDRLDEIEIEEIKQHNSYESGYNSTPGGEFITLETRDKISKGNSGKKHWSYGKRIPDETRRKMSEAHKGSKHWLYGKHVSEETKKKLSKINKGKKHSKETKEKLSGENSPVAKFSLKIANEIRAKYATGKYTHRKLAKEYGVVNSTICYIINKIRWNK